MTRVCWLASDPCDGRTPLVAAQFAQLLGLDCPSWKRSEPLDAGVADPRRHMIALSYRTVRSLSADQGSRLRDFVNAGAILYIRGGFRHRDEQCFIRPIVDEAFSYARCRKASAYRIEAQRVVPEVLHGETVSGEFMLPSARGIPERAEPLANARFEDGEWAPFLFSIRYGAGTVICDLLPDSSAGSPDLPIADRLADPLSRHAEIGALMSVRLAAGINPAARPALNFILDDRPANFDYFNTGNLRRWLQQVETQFPGVHVDFAWTPDQLHPTRAYVETLKQFNTGVVWHGFKHHIRHHSAPNLADDLRDGIEMVGDISNRFRVRFQPIMIFPFESFGLDTVPLLQDGGFLATYASSLAPLGISSPFPPFIDSSTPMYEQFNDMFPVLRRRGCESLTRDMMLSHAALNLPIITVLHPFEIGLRRWPYSPVPEGAQADFDRILSFASAKRLESRSLEEIARDALARPSPRAIERGELSQGHVRQIH